MGEINSSNNFWLHILNNFEILLVIEKLDIIYQKIGQFAPIFGQK